MLYSLREIFFECVHLAVEYSKNKPLAAKSIGLVLSLFFALLVLRICGCFGTTPTTTLELVPVSGSVVFVGSEVIPGEISFKPDQTFGTSGPVAIGVVNSDGTFTLKTVNRSGAPIGHYLVSFRPLYTDSPSPSMSNKQFIIQNPNNDTSEVKREIHKNISNKFDFQIIAKPFEAPVVDEE